MWCDKSVLGILACLIGGEPKKFHLDVDLKVNFGSH